MKSILRLILLLAIFIFSNLNCYSNLDIKISDAISPFFNKNEKIKHYSNIPFYQLDLYNENLVDYDQLKESKIRFIKYIKLLKDNGYNSLSLDDLNHLTIFDKSGFYKGSTLEKRNKIYIAYYKELIKIADDNDINVYINTDMQFYTDLLEEKIGYIDKNNDFLKKLNKEAFEELFLNFPTISGVIIRIGEGGNAYNSGPYKSKIIYKTSESVNKFLKNLLPLFEKNDKRLIFRTWTIGIGEIGDLIINKETYDKTFEGINSNNLIVSVKHTPGDYFWFEKLNPIIGYGNLSQIVEIQIRREYEGGGDFPNYMGDYYKEIIEKIKNKKNIVGVYNWNQTGGWGWGNNILFNYGFNFWNEVNFFSVGEILKNGNPDLDKILDKYNFNSEEKKVLKKILKNSREIIKKGWYINDFRKKYIKIGNIYLPSLSRIWWDRTTSSPIVLSLIYNSLDKKFETIEESSFLLGIQKKEIEQWKTVSKNNDLNEKITNTLINRYKIFEINHLFKKAFIIYFQTGEKDYFEEIDNKIKEYKDFSINKDYINYNFDEIYNFYGKEKNVLYLYLNLFFLLILILFIYYYKKIKRIYKKNIKKKLIILTILGITILNLTITPFLFLSEFNFYWIIVKINYIVLPIILIYFLIINIIISKIYGIKIKLKHTFGKIIYGILPIVLINEFIILISYIFGEQFFWRFLALGFIKTQMKAIIIIISIIYFGIFIWYAIHFSNIRKFIKELKHKKLIYIISIISLFLFLLIIYNLDQDKIFIKNIINNLLPTYFQSAGTDSGDFF